MSKRYEHLLSPICIRNKVIKSRFYYPVAQPHFLQGPEPYPARPVVEYFTRLMKNGVGIAIFQDLTNPEQKTMPGHDTSHFCMYDLDDPGCQNYFNQFTHAIHCRGGVICAEMGLDMRLGYCVNDPDKPSPPRPRGGNPYGVIVGPEGMKGGDMKPPKQTYLTPENMVTYVDTVVEHLKKYKSAGFDGCMLNMRASSLIGHFMNPYYNVRTDEYGGSLENRMRFPLYFMSRVRRELGEDFLIVCNAPHYGDNTEFGRSMPIEDAVALLKAAEPYCDLLHLSYLGEDHEKDKPETAADQAAELKALGVGIPIAVNTPYMDLDKLEAIIAGGKADMIASAHMFICNDELGDILREGRGEDLAPCIGCHICRGSSFTGDWMSHCTINPVVGMAHRLDLIVEPVTKTKRVAVIGGGPGGMACAQWLKKRGHTPVIFEASDALGGQIKTSRYPDFKWELCRYLDYLIDKTRRMGIEVRLNTSATPEMIASEGFDAVVAATGAVPKTLNVPGAENARWNIVNVYGNEDKIGHRVVVVGGASGAAEAAVYLAKLGHEVTELSRKNIIAYDLNPIRSRGYMNHLAKVSGVNVIADAKTTAIGPDSVTYTDKDGESRTIRCDDILAAGGMLSSAGDAVKFAGAADEFYAIGDARAASNLRTAIADAYAAAMRI